MYENDDFASKLGLIKPGYEYIVIVRGPFDHEIKRVPSNPGPANEFRLDMRIQDGNK